MNIAFPFSRFRGRYRGEAMNTRVYRLPQQTRARMIDWWAGEEAFGSPIGCVKTSFTFDAELFEDQCLARSVIQSNPKRKREGLPHRARGKSSRNLSPRAGSRRTR